MATVNGTPTAGEGEENMKDFRLALKLRNNRILHRMEELEYPTVGQVCKAHPKLNATLTYGLVNLRLNPIESRTGAWRMIVYQLADALAIMPDDLFSEDLLRERQLNRARMEVDAGEMTGLLAATRQLASSPYAEFDRVELAATIAATLHTLTPKEEKVVRARFGLDGGEPAVLGDIGGSLGVSRERIRQIESKALRKLRQPAKARPPLPWALEARGRYK